MKKSTKMSPLELEILQKLGVIMEYDQNLLSNNGHELFNQLSDLAKEEN